MNPAAEPAPLPRGLRIAVTVLVMGASLMYVLDSTIANVALPHMQAALGATQDSVSWVLTSYIIASAIAMPVTGWLEGRIGRRALFIGAIAGFTISSAACGLAPSLGGVVVARAVQGMFGAFLSPMSQAIMLDTYPPEKRAQAMMIWGMGIMIGPIMGPVLGGWLTDQFDWRWVFFINVPIGIVLVVAMLALLPGKQGIRRRFDLTGFVLIALLLASMQLMLDRGTQLDWFDSPEIMIEAGVFAATLWMFVVHSLTTRDPLISLGLFRDRNFVLASIFLMVVNGLLIGGAALIAPMLQGMLGYDTVDSGLLIAPRGFAMMAAMLIGGRLANVVDARVMIGLGLTMVVVGQWMMTGFSLQMDAHLVLVTGLFQGFGFGLVTMPLNLLAFSTLSPMLRTEGTAFYSLARTVGGSIAISAMTALLARNTQVSHADLSAHVTTLTLPFLTDGLVRGMGGSGAAIAQMLDLEVNRQALMIAYLDNFWITSLASLVVLPLVLFMRRGRKGDAADAAMALE